MPLAQPVAYRYVHKDGEPRARNNGPGWSPILNAIAGLSLAEVPARDEYSVKIYMDDGTARLVTVVASDD